MGQLGTEVNRRDVFPREKLRLLLVRSGIKAGWRGLVLARLSNAKPRRCKSLELCRSSIEGDSRLVEIEESKAA